MSDFYFMYDTDDAKLSSAEIAAGVATGRLVDRRAGCTLPLAPRIVNVVAWHNIPAEVTAVSAGFVVARDAEANRRLANGVAPGSTYTLPRTTPTLTPSETTNVGTGSATPTSVDASSSTLSTDKSVRSVFVGCFDFRFNHIGRRVGDNIINNENEIDASNADWLANHNEHCNERSHVAKRFR